MAGAETAYFTMARRALLEPQGNVFKMFSKDAQSRVPCIDI
jgi:hypothetical protein